MITKLPTARPIKVTIKFSPWESDSINTHREFKGKDGESMAAFIRRAALGGLRTPGAMVGPSEARHFCNCLRCTGGM